MTFVSSYCAAFHTCLQRLLSIQIGVGNCVGRCQSARSARHHSNVHTLLGHPLQGSPVSFGCKIKSYESVLIFDRFGHAYRSRDARMAETSSCRELRLFARGKRGRKRLSSVEGNELVSGLSKSPSVR
jgi:hypothetical protein